MPIPGVWARHMGAVLVARPGLGSAILEGFCPLTHPVVKPWPLLRQAEVCPLCKPAAPGLPPSGCGRAALWDGMGWDGNVSSCPLGVPELQRPWGCNAWGLCACAPLPSAGCEGRSSGRGLAWAGQSQRRLCASSSSRRRAGAAPSPSLPPTAGTVRAGAALSSPGCVFGIN